MPCLRLLPRCGISQRFSHSGAPVQRRGLRPPSPTGRVSAGCGYHRGRCVVGSWRCEATVLQPPCRQYDSRLQNRPAAARPPSRDRGSRSAPTRVGSIPWMHRAVARRGRNAIDVAYLRSGFVSQSSLIGRHASPATEVHSPIVMDAQIKLVGGNDRSVLSLATAP